MLFHCPFYWFEKNVFLKGVLVDDLHLNGDRTASHLSWVPTARSRESTLVEIAKPISERVGRRIREVNITSRGDKVWKSGDLARSTLTQVSQSRVQSLEIRLVETKKAGENWKRLSVLDGVCEWQVWNAWWDTQALLGVDGVGAADLRVESVQDLHVDSSIQGNARHGVTGGCGEGQGWHAQGVASNDIVSVGDAWVGGEEHRWGHAKSGCQVIDGVALLNLVRHASHRHALVGEEVDVGAAKVDVNVVHLSIVQGAIAVGTAINLDDVAVAGSALTNVVVLSVAWIVVIDVTTTEGELNRSWNAAVDLAGLVRTSGTSDKSSLLEIVEGTVVEVKEVIGLWRGSFGGVEVAWCGLKGLPDSVDGSESAQGVWRGVSGSTTSQLVVDGDVASSSLSIALSTTVVGVRVRIGIRVVLSGISTIVRSDSSNIRGEITVIGGEGSSLSNLVSRSASSSLGVTSGTSLLAVIVIGIGICVCVSGILGACIRASS